MSYQGHPSRNYWNVSLWIGGDESLYRLALSCIRANRTRREAAEVFVDNLRQSGIVYTPDGSPFTVASVMHGMRGLT